MLKEGNKIRKDQGAAESSHIRLRSTFHKESEIKTCIQLLFLLWKDLLIFYNFITWPRLILLN